MFTFYNLLYAAILYERTFQTILIQEHLARWRGFEKRDCTAGFTDMVCRAWHTI